MKKILFAFAAASVSALAVNHGAYAQDHNNIAVLEPAKDIIKMDKTIAIEKSNTVKLNDISAKAVKNFTKSYKTSGDEVWYKAPDGFRVRFLSNDITNVIFYDKSGHWAGSLKGYSEDKLARDIRGIVKSKYYDYTIPYVQEIESAGVPGVVAYIVHLEDEHEIKLIRVCENEMNVYQEFKK